MHQHVTHNRAYPTQKLFTKAILKFFRKIILEQWHNFQNQVTDNFRIISERNIRVLEWVEYKNFYSARNRETAIENPRVGGSISLLGTIFTNKYNAINIAQFLLPALHTYRTVFRTPSFRA